ncbi:MAG: hypothetical protein IT458_16835 [Planctomycetes bacterium]|nr:hypothetical protein [Planctomycetota bacterium]
MQVWAGVAASLFAACVSSSCPAAAAPQESRASPLPRAPHPWLLASVGERVGRGEILPMAERLGGARSLQGRLLDQGQTLLLEESRGQGRAGGETLRLLRATADGRSLQMASFDPADGLLRSLDGTYDPELDAVRWEPYWPRNRDLKRWWLVEERLPEGRIRWRRWELAPDGKELEVLRIVYEPLPVQAGGPEAPGALARERGGGDAALEERLQGFAGAWSHRTAGPDEAGVELRIDSLGARGVAVLALRVERGGLCEEAYGLLVVKHPPEIRGPVNPVDLALLPPGEPCVLSLSGHLYPDGTTVRFAEPEGARVLWTWSLGDEHLELSWTPSHKHKQPPPLGVAGVCLTRRR